MRARPPIRPDLDVYLDGNRLIYNKDACSKDDISENFFLALYPADESDLPEDRRLHGLDNLDFSFFEHTFHRGKRCIARTPLPEYDFASIYTGQYIQQADGSTEHIWEGEARLTEAAT